MLETIKRRVRAAITILIPLEIIAVVIGGGWYVLTHEPPKKAAAAVSTAPQTITRFRMAEKTGSFDSWNLEAAHAIIAPGGKELEAARMRYLPAVKWGMPMELGADKAVVDNATLNIDFAGNVVMQTKTPLTLRTSKLLWKQGDLQLTSDDAATLETPAASLASNGIRVYMEQKTFLLRGGVRAAYGHSAPDRATGITADRAVTEAGLNRIRFDGNVTVTNGAVLLTAETLEVYTDATGHEVKKIIAVGNVRMSKGGRHIEGARAEMNYAGRRVLLTSPHAKGGWTTYSYDKELVAIADKG